MPAILSPRLLSPHPIFCDSCIYLLFNIGTYHDTARKGQFNIVSTVTASVSQSHPVNTYIAMKKYSRNQKKKQECIPVGCVPPARTPYLPGRGGGGI